MSRRLFLILGFILLTSAATAAQQGALPPDIAKKVDDLVVMQMEAQKIPGMTVAIAVDGVVPCAVELREVAAPGQRF